MTADVLASATMWFTIQDMQVLLFQKEGFQLLAGSQCLEQPAHMGRNSMHINDFSISFTIGNGSRVCYPNLRFQIFDSMFTPAAVLSHITTKPHSLKNETKFIAHWSPRQNGLHF